MEVKIISPNGWAVDIKFYLTGGEGGVTHLIEDNFRAKYIAPLKTS